MADVPFPYLRAAGPRIVFGRDGCDHKGCFPALLGVQRSQRRGSILRPGHVRLSGSRPLNVADVNSQCSRTLLLLLTTFLFRSRQRWVWRAWARRRRRRRLRCPSSPSASWVRDADAVDVHDFSQGSATNTNPCKIGLARRGTPYFCCAITRELSSHHVDQRNLV